MAKVEKVTLKYIFDLERPNGLHFEILDRFDEGQTLTDITAENVFSELVEAVKKYPDCWITVFEVRQVLGITPSS